MAASTIAPMAMAIPPRLMMFAVNPIKYIGMKERMIVIGMVIMGTRAEGMCQRKIMITMLTIMSSSINVLLRVSIDRSIKSARSYVVTISTPGGSEGLNSSSFARTRSMTFSAFSPKRMMTMPPTTSPSPFRSATPLLISGPRVTIPRSFTKMGVPLLDLTPTTMFSISETFLI